MTLAQEYQTASLAAATAEYRRRTARRPQDPCEISGEVHSRDRRGDQRRSSLVLAGAGRVRNVAFVGRPRAAIRAALARYDS